MQQCIRDSTFVSMDNTNASADMKISKPWKTVPPSAAPDLDEDLNEIYADRSRRRESTRHATCNQIKKCRFDTEFCPFPLFDTPKIAKNGRVRTRPQVEFD